MSKPAIYDVRDAYVTRDLTAVIAPDLAELAAEFSVDVKHVMNMAEAEEWGAERLRNISEFRQKRKEEVKSFLDTSAVESAQALGLIIKQRLNITNKLNNQVDELISQRLDEGSSIHIRDLIGIKKILLQDTKEVAQLCLTIHQILNGGDASESEKFGHEARADQVDRLSKLLQAADINQLTSVVNVIAAHEHSVLDMTTKDERAQAFQSLELL